MGAKKDNQGPGMTKSEAEQTRFWQFFCDRLKGAKAKSMSYAEMGERLERMEAAERKRPRR